MILRPFHGRLWQVHSPTSYRLNDRPFWVERDKDGRWRCRREGRKRRAEFKSRDEAMEYVAIAFAMYGDSAA